ncbi:MAG: FAD-dependent oxidoreductase, partial [Betaproteobacteria bacterium AqS2]|nr:FAD-dependent oxidoreductase [Betaproteobacteria bacterium AqS2]
MAKYDYNLIVIGGGSAGLVTAIVAAGAKAKVALVEKHRMGGDCLNTGCVPSKALIRSASFMRDAKRCKALGFESAKVEYDFAAVMERVARIIKAIEPHDSVERFTKEGVECFAGEARIKSPHEVEVDGKVMTTKAIAVCSGARPFVPPIKNIENAPHHTSDSIWELRERPRRMLVLGGGPIGSELAQAFAYLGIEVTLVQGNSQLLPREDPDAAKLVYDAMHDAGVEVMLGTKALECVEGDGGWALRCEGAGGGIKEIGFDVLLVAAGRTPNALNLPGLAEAGVKVDGRGAVQVDEYLRTSVPGIYACGDVIGGYQFTHTAGHAGFFCALNALAAPFFRLKVDWSVVPWCTFTHPEVA